jgi:hypothetical protein
MIRIRSWRGLRSEYSFNETKITAQSRTGIGGKSARGREELHKMMRDQLYVVKVQIRPGLESYHTGG